MANVLLLHYNNYFNRRIKKLNTTAEYIAADTNYVTCTDVNFVPADGITTTLIVGQGANPSTLFTGSKKDFDYVVVYHLDTTVTPAVNVIDSRWFIIEENRLRDGQYEFSLKRDSVADNYDEVMNATTYVEKGFITPENKLIFNSEGLEVNQIKTDEIKLKDASQCPWLIAYIAKNQGSKTCTINYQPAQKDYIEVSASTLQNWEYYTYIENPFYGPLSNPTYRINWQRGTDDNWHYGHYKTVVSSTGNAGTSSISNDDWNYILRTSSNSINPQTVNADIQTQWQNVGANNINSTLNSSLGCHTSSELSALRYYNGKTIKTLDGKFYQISVYSTSAISYNETYITNLSLPIITQVQTIVRATGDFSASYNTLNARSLMVTASASGWQVTATEIPSKEVTLEFSGTRTHTIDALYDIIAIPYGELSVGYFSGSGTQTYTELLKTNENLSMATMNSLAVALTNASVYDVQLLPYCPLQADLVGEGQIAIDTANGLGIEFSYVVDNSTNPATNVGIVFYVKESNFVVSEIEHELSYLHKQVISGFDRVPTPTGQYESWIKNNIEYVFPNLNTPTTTTPSFPSYRVATVENSREVDNIKIMKINRTTGSIIETYYAQEIECVYDISDATQNTLTIRNVGNQLLDSFTYSAYSTLDYYIAFIISGGFGGARLDEMAEVVKLPIINGLISDSYSLKIDNECRKYKLVSPNYQGEFEFSVAKNYGVDYFTVDCTYKPYNPYIHVNPNFKGLYGKDFDDGRGLVCNGDFSFGMIGDKFAEYELQNKNYQSVFNRQVQNMDVNNAIAREQQTFSGLAGIVTGGAAGAIAGSKAGPYGAIAGGIAGTAVGGIGAALDWKNLTKAQSEQRSFATDMYKYSLQNIQALPYSLSRCSALTANNKLFPFVEIYSCSTEEEDAFVNKLKFDGMSVLAIGHIKDYLEGTGDTLVRGEIIRFESLKADSHLASDIYDELKKGVYL